jgi:putative pre-16S rRNA nuclease
MPTKTNTILALDVGAKRIGLAVADSLARLPRPFTTLENSEAVFVELQKIIAEEAVESVIVGLPRDMNGQTTQQTRDTQTFVAQLKTQIGLPIHMQDEAVTSRQAEAELSARQRPYSKADIDALAATYILDDYLRDHSGVAGG